MNDTSRRIDMAAAGAAAIDQEFTATQRPVVTQPKHAIRIESPHGKVFLTKVYLDGQQLRGVMAAHVDFDYPRDQNVLVTLTLAPGSLVLARVARVVVKSELQDEIGKKEAPE